MNSLSWLIYAAEVVDGLKNLLIGLNIGALFILGGTAIPACIGKFDDIMGDGTFYDTIWLPAIRRAWPLVVAAFVVAALLPSQKTVMLIVASEIGGKVVQSKATSDIIDPGLDYLQKWIRKQTKEIAKDEK